MAKKKAKVNVQKMHSSMIETKLDFRKVNNALNKIGNISAEEDLNVVEFGQLLHQMQMSLNISLIDRYYKAKYGEVPLPDDANTGYR